ncbi:MAG: riboflavin synthase [Frankia sp.]|nr:riboflavin synthase [Frankia sp.]
MFTGIVEELGAVRDIAAAADGARLTIRAALTADLAPGDSVAVNGCCLTAAVVDGDTFTADVMGESLQRTNLGALHAGDPVNLERPVTLQARLGGHLVQGHVDSTATITSRTHGESWDTVRIALPAALARYVVVKGSVTVDGVSLTVVDVADEEFSVGLIPTTLARTTLGRKGAGDAVNLEVDVVAKYVERLLARSAT